jgi:hypothetical protein
MPIAIGGKCYTLYCMFVSYFVYVIFHCLNTFVTNTKFHKETAASVFQIPATVWVSICLRSCPAEHCGEPGDRRRRQDEK